MGNVNKAGRVLWATRRFLVNVCLIRMIVTQSRGKLKGSAQIPLNQKIEAPTSRPFPSKDSLSVLRTLRLCNSKQLVVSGRHFRSSLEEFFPFVGENVLWGASSQRRRIRERFFFRVPLSYIWKWGFAANWRGRGSVIQLKGSHATTSMRPLKFS